MRRPAHPSDSSGPAPAPAGDLAPSSALLNARTMPPGTRAEMRLVLDEAIRLASRDQLGLKIPRDARPVQHRRDMHYHYRPEIFLQLQGWTDFVFPKSSFRLAPNELCVIPAGVPHGETVSAEPDRPFRNLVIGFYNNTLSLHFAHEASPRKPDIECIEFFDAPNLEVFITLANTLSQTSAAASASKETVLKGLVLALLGLLRNVIDVGGSQLNSDIGKVFQAKCVVREQFPNAELSVQRIAEGLGCSADYLSHLFHTETKERLTHYIQRIRIEAAAVELESTPLTISEIAYATGFSDPAYFARVFKRHKGITPQDFRTQLGASRTQREVQPKTVYFDRLDFSHGSPTHRTPVTAEATAPR